MGAEHGQLLQLDAYVVPGNRRSTDDQGGGFVSTNMLPSCCLLLFLRSFSVGQTVSHLELVERVMCV